MELTFLGSGNAFAAGGRYWSSFIADRHVPVRRAADAARPPQEARSLPPRPRRHLPHPPPRRPLRRPPVPPARVRLRHATTNATSRSSALPAVEEWMEDFACRCYPEITRKETGYQRIYVDADPGKLPEGQRHRVHLLPDEPRHEDACGPSATGSRSNGKHRRLHRRHDVLRRDLRPRRKAPTSSSSTAPTSRAAARSTWASTTFNVIRKRLPESTAMILTHLNGCPNVAGMKNVFVAEDLKTFNFP